MKQGTVQQVVKPDAASRPVSVNLLPEAVRVAQVGRRRMEAWAAVLALAAMMAGGVWLWSRTRNAELRHVRAVLAEGLADIRLQEKQRLALAARAEVLAKRQSILDQMRARESWATRLAELAAAVPDQAVLCRIETVAAARKPAAGAASGEAPWGPPPVDVQLEGYAADHQVLASFLHRLQASGTYREVWLVRSSAAKTGPAECLDFAVVCRR